MEANPPEHLTSSMTAALIAGRKLWIGLHSTSPLVVDAPVEDPHCTLLHLGCPPARQALWVEAAVAAARVVADQVGPFSARVGGVARFSSRGGEDPLVLLLQEPQVRDLRSVAMRRVSEIVHRPVETIRGLFDYTPHVTFGKIASDSPVLLASRSGQIEFTHVGVTCGGYRYLIPFLEAEQLAGA